MIAEREMRDARSAGGGVDGAGGLVLVADDQPDVLEAMRLMLKLSGFGVRTASSPAAVLAMLQDGTERFDLLVMDLNYARDTTSGREGLELVARVTALDPTLPIVVMTAWSTVPLAVSTMRNGVSDFVEKPWDNAHMLAIVGAQIAAGRQRRRLARLESDARDVQRRLLARGAPDVEGYSVGAAWRFAESLGGDAYEITDLPGGRLGVAIADVCGKGTPAALVMASAQATLRDLLAAPIEPHEVCARLGAALMPRLAPERFVSLAYCVVDRHRRTLTCANAGHPPPLILRRDGTLERLAAGGPVLGLLAGARYEQETVPFDRGDRLVLYTDGVVEAGTTDEMGEGRLAAGLAELRTASAPEAATGVIALADRYAGGARLADDATAVVVDLEPDAG